MSLPTVYKIDDADRRNISQLKAAIGAEGVEVGEKWLSGAVSATLEDFFWTPDNYRNHIITFLAMYRLAPTGFFRPMIRSFTGITREKFVEAAKANGSPYYTTGSVYKFAALLEELVNPVTAYTRIGGGVGSSCPNVVVHVHPAETPLVIHSLATHYYDQAQDQVIHLVYKGCVRSTHIFIWSMCG
ncbi:hypothetical protein FOZ60_008983 [Perkinsus olseni]|uniref:Uncharacterized protein n=1 Tax=Perkinsus olseni TaxID=32597 RepID=A0A7J6PFG2_PEROL|nr:hypothetical protein FOZ60_008983 [Perkinsus olseni]